MLRRDFLKAGIGGAASFALLQPRVFAAGNDAPLRVGLIGCGWYGKTDLLHLIQVAPVDVVGLCDVDSQMVAEAAELVAQRQPSKKRPPTYGDYRKLLADQRPEIVLIGTPDHWHCLPMVEACKGGADVYVPEADQLRRRRRPGDGRRRAKIQSHRPSRPAAPQHAPLARSAATKFVRSGKLGKIAHVEIHSYYGSRRDFPASTAPPEHLDWDNYVGPAAWRDYNSAIHPRAWRDCREFSNGQTGDLCVHFFDFVRYALDLGWPQTIISIWRHPHAR